MTGQFTLFSGAKLSRRQLLSWNMFKANITWFVRIIQFFGVICEIALFHILLPAESTSQVSTIVKWLQFLNFSGVAYISSCLSGENRAYKPAIGAFLSLLALPPLSLDSEEFVSLKPSMRALLFGKFDKFLAFLEPLKNDSKLHFLIQHMRETSHK